MNHNNQQESSSFVFERKSVRHYLPSKLDAKTIQDLQFLRNRVEVLVKENVLHINFHDYSRTDDTSQALGYFGRIISAPHFFVPFIAGKEYTLPDLGYRTQQIILEMWRLGIGSCYIGCAHREKKVQELCKLPAEATVITCVVFGIADKGQPEKLYRKISQFFVRSNSRLDLKDVFINGSAEYFEDLDEPVKKIINAGRYAPSAVNAQPWRFLIKDGYFFIFAKLNQNGKMYDPKNAYCLHDAGVCMANMSVMAQELGYHLQWEQLGTHDSKLLDQPFLMPIANFSILDVRRLN